MNYGQRAEKTQEISEFIEQLGSGAEAALFFSNETLCTQLAANILNSKFDDGTDAEIALIHMTLKHKAESLDEAAKAYEQSQRGYKGMREDGCGETNNQWHFVEADDEQHALSIVRAEGFIVDGRRIESDYDCTGQWGVSPATVEYSHIMECYIVKIHSYLDC